MVAMCTNEVQEKFVQRALQTDVVQSSVFNFKPKISFRLVAGQYSIETAQTATDILSVLYLRHHSFVEEFLPGQTIEWIDFDEYDLIGDHVLVRDLKSNEIIGTYRIMCSEFTNNFYTETQFHLGSFKSKPGVKIELGRACIHKNYRNGAILSLVWKGLARYAELVNARYMFGCASIRTVSQIIAESIYWHLYPAHFDPQYNMSVLDKYKFNELSRSNELLAWSEVESHIPPLLKTYLQAGSKICTEPGLDNFFKCIDFVTIQDLQNLDAKYRKRYFTLNA